MDTEAQLRIKEVRLDPEGRLLVLPDLSTTDATDLRFFPFVYRAAMGVDWDEEGKAFRSKRPEPNGWSYGDWFGQILRATAEELGVILSIDSDTRWSVSDEVRQQIEPKPI